MKYSICIDALFPKESADYSIGKVKECGFSAIEFWSWADKDIEHIVQTCTKLGVSVSTFCTGLGINPGNPDNHKAYLDGLRASIKIAKNLGCSTLIAQAGWSIPNIPFDQHRNALLRLFSDASPLLEEAGMTLVIEPLNTKVDHPGYHLVSSQDAFDLVHKINSPYVKILFDIYHQQISEGNILQTISENIMQIGHFHIAGVPGRVEPMCGELNYPFILNEINKMNYNGYIGLEYMPKRDAIKTLQETYSLLLG